MRKQNAAAVYKLGHAEENVARYLEMAKSEGHVVSQNQFVLRMYSMSPKKNELILLSFFHLLIFKSISSIKINFTIKFS